MIRLTAFPMTRLPDPRGMTRSWAVTAFGVAIGLAPAAPSRAQQAGPACGDVPGSSALDFWLGEWEVRVDGEVVGENTIAKILDGCAVTEHWRSRAGGEGRSLFYPEPGTGRWKQVWVTGRATAPGGVPASARAGGP